MEDLTQPNLLGREWSALHHDCERGEAHALWVKLGAIGLTVVALALSFDAVLTMALLAVLWLQESIVRTGQSRLVARLLRVEAALRGDTAGQRGCQLYTEWQAGRPGTLGLLAQYLSQAVRPTVAFPHVALIVLLWAVAISE